MRDSLVSSAQGGTMEGFLEKSSTGKLKRIAKGEGYVMAPQNTLGNLMAKWDKRFFVLNGSTLSYYKEESDYHRRKAAGALDIDGAMIDETLTTAGPNSFGIETRERTLMLRSLSRPTGSARSRKSSRDHAKSDDSNGAADVDAWIAALCRAGARHRLGSCGVRGAHTHSQTSLLTLENIAMHESAPATEPSAAPATEAVVESEAQNRSQWRGPCNCLDYVPVWATKCWQPTATAPAKSRRAEHGDDASVALI